MSSASRGLCGETGIISGGDGSGDRPLWSCCCFKRSYSACRFLLGSDKGTKVLWLLHGAVTRYLLSWGVMCLTLQGSPAPPASPSPESTYLWAHSLQSRINLVLEGSEVQSCLKALGITRTHNGFPPRAPDVGGSTQSRVWSVLGSAFPQLPALYPSQKWDCWFPSTHGYT